MQLFRHWDAVRFYEMPDAWVRRVAIRLAVRRSRRERRRGVLESLNAASSTGEAGLDNMADVDLLRAVATLSPMQRAAVVLHYWDDQPVLEIARCLRVSESTVKQHLFRARTRLATILGEEVSEDADR